MKKKGPRINLSNILQTITDSLTVSTPCIISTSIINTVNALHYPSIISRFDNINIKRAKWSNNTVWENMYGSTTVCEIFSNLPHF